MSDLVAVMVERDVAAWIKSSAKASGLDLATMMQLNATDEKIEALERYAAVVEACRQALSNPSVTVEGEAKLVEPDDYSLTRFDPFVGLNPGPDGFELPADFPEGKCLVTITPLTGGQEQ